VNILLTGGAGYIGSHTAAVLSEVGHEVILIDNFCNSSPKVLTHLKDLLGKEIPCIKADIRDTHEVCKVLKEHKIDAVIHFAGLKSVSESVDNPVEYYANNMQGTISLLEAMKTLDVKTLVFSSSATVYGEPRYLPIDESHPTSATNPYGRSKLHVEEMLRDIASSDDKWKIICLRYFNPVGAHESGLIGEDPGNIPSNLMPYIALVAAEKFPHLNIYGNDFPTHDGTGVRDYIHVMDLADGHLAALNYVQNHSGWDVFNLGTGHGVSVLEMISSYGCASGKKIAYQFKNRRLGDVASCYAEVNKAHMHLGWAAKRSLNDMCQSSWRFQERSKVIDYE
jgi:UDP-glucose 4-epimerase